MKSRFLPPHTGQSSPEGAGAAERANGKDRNSRRRISYLDAVGGRKVPEAVLISFS